MPEDTTPSSDGTARPDDVKARFKEALARKQSHDPGVADRGPKKSRPHGTQGPQGGVQMHRRKAGGGGA